MATYALTGEAVGGEILLQMPRGPEATFEIHSVYVDYETKGPPTGARSVRITLEDPLGTVLAITGGDTQPVNTRRHYMAFYNAPLARVPAGDDIQWCPWPPTAVVPGGSFIRAKNVAVLSGGTPNDKVRLRIQYDRSLGNRGL